VHIETVHEILDAVEVELGDALDTEREYVTGLSMVRTHRSPRPAPCPPLISLRGGNVSDRGRSAR